MVVGMEPARADARSATTRSVLSHPHAINSVSSQSQSMVHGSAHHPHHAPTATATASSALASTQPEGVTLGLFSKIAAARKEKMNTLPRGSGAPFDKQLMAAERNATNLDTCHFPDISEARSSTTRASLNTKKTSAPTPASAPAPAPALAPAPAPAPGRTSGLNGGPSLRWTNSLPEESVKSLTISKSPLIRGAQDRLQRLSVVELARTNATDRDDSVTRPSSSSDAHALDASSASTSSFGVHNASRKFQAESSSSNASDSTAAHRKFRQPEGSFRLQQTKSNAADATNGKSQQQQQQQHPQMDLSTEQDVYFAEAAEIPGVPIVYRNQKSKASSPERLNLDRRNLRVIPLLEGEQMLRLLNLQNNVITHIDNLLELPNLIFLDLYNNRVEKLENFHVVPNLRVLMLGKNKIKRIENLECLRKLDVLDLHSNEIEVMENLNELMELRVLNLGGNRISVVDNIDRLVLLTELNLRRNNVVHISPIGNLPSLQRLFLSNNKLESLSCIEPLFEISSISELRLDSNKLCDVDPSKYRWQMIQKFPALKHLDLKPLSETERKDVVRLMAQSRLKEQEKQELEACERVAMIETTCSNWEKRVTKSRSASSDKTSKSNKTPRKGSDAKLLVTSHESNELQPITREDATVHRNKNGFSEIEVFGKSEGSALCVYGDAALDALTNPKAQTSVNTIVFRYISIDRIAWAATSNSGSLKLFSKLKKLVFRFNDIASLDQLTWICSMGSKAEELVIMDNPIASLTLLPCYVGAKLSNVIKLNDRLILPDERVLGDKLFPPHNQAETNKPPSHMASLQLARRQRSAESLISDGRVGRDTKSAGRHHNTSLMAPASFILSEIVSGAKDAEQKSNVVDECWDALILAFVKDTLGDFEKNESYLSGCLDGL